MSCGTFFWVYVRLTSGVFGGPVISLDALSCFVSPSFLYGICGVVGQIILLSRDGVAMRDACCYFTCQLSCYVADYLKKEKNNF